MTVATQAVAQQITFFGREGFEGGSITIDRAIGNVERSGFNERASSAVVSGDWEVCNGPEFTGRCFTLLPGQYPSLRDIGLGDGVSSARLMSRHAPIADPRHPLLQSGPQIVFTGSRVFGANHSGRTGPS